MMISKLTLYKQVTILCVTLVLLTAFSLLGISFWKTVNFNEQKIDQNIVSAENVLREYLKAKEDLLVTASRVVTADFGFKQAVATQDKGTIESVLQNHGSRINASLMILTDLNGRLISSNNESLFNDHEITSNISAIRLNLKKTQLALMGGDLYQIIVLPVKAPRKIAYTIIGFKIDQAYINELKRLTAVEISFYNNDNLLITTLNEEKAGVEKAFNIADLFWYVLDRKVYETKSIELNNSVKGEYFAELSADLTPSYLELDKLLMAIIALSVFIVLFAIITSHYLAKSLTSPLYYLTDIANDFAKGDYQKNNKTVKGSVEVQRLYDSFIEMGHKILQRETRISYQARHDSLTDLYNRSTLINVLSECIERYSSNDESNLLLMGVNIRSFKRINDSFGSYMGDLTLKAVAEIINSFYVDKQCVVGRLSGDEFLIVLNYKTSDEYKTLIEEFTLELKKSIYVNGLQLNLNYGVGACLYPSQGKSAKDLVRRTIIALDATRNGNKEFRLYQNGEDEVYLERLNLVEELRVVMKNDSNELFMVYQPKLNLGTNKIEKVESLIRWIKSDGSFVSPELFIDLAEQAGLIIELTHWVIDSVLNQQAAWVAAGVNLKVAINISAQDIVHCDFIDFLYQKIDLYKTDPKYITLELTERDIMTNEDLVISRLSQLQALGFQISIDDYGIGQSSLSKLKQLPIDELKIDKAFILKLNTSEKDQQIVSSTIELGHKLGLSVVAEGVENEESLNMLREMNCDHIQGYHLSRPVKSEVLIDWLKEFDVF